jgi:hypothetical protein
MVLLSNTFESNTFENNTFENNTFENNIHSRIIHSRTIHSSIRQCKIRPLFSDLIFYISQEAPLKKIAETAPEGSTALHPAKTATLTRVWRASTAEKVSLREMN